MIMQINRVNMNNGETSPATINALLVTHFFEVPIPRQVKTPFPKMGTMVCFGSAGLPVDMTPEEFEAAWLEVLSHVSSKHA